jgi:nucleoside recognition membrane protein YjiH
MEEKKDGEGLGISGFTLGILSIVFLGTFGVIISLIGFILCLVQQKRKKFRMAKTGMILNIIGFALSLLYMFVLGPIIQNYLLKIVS